MPKAGGEVRRQVVVWRVAGALLAAPVEDVQEVATTGQDGLARTRVGPMDLTPVPGLRPEQPARHAVVVRAGADVLALAAEAVEGVRIVSPASLAALPAWLRTLDPGHVAGLVRFGPEIAALLRLDALAPRV